MKLHFAACLALIVSVYNASANLLVNPGFETPVDTTDFTDSDWATGGGLEPGRGDFAARSGLRGGYMPGWAGPGNGLVYQDVPVTTGTWTFSIWIRQELEYTARTNELRVGFYDADTNLLEESSATFLNILSDNAWHHLYATASCDSQSLSFARATYRASCGAPGAGNSAAFFDDAEFYAGVHAPTPLSNPSFERPAVDADGHWRASQWQNRPDLGGGNKYAFENWANHGGAWGIGLWGWDVADLSNSVAIFQNLSPGPGTHTFTCYLRREGEFYLSNALLRIEWFDRTFTNKVCADTVTNLVVPNDYTWREYALTGTCDSNTLYEARPSVFVEWWQNTNPVPGQALQIDDARFLPGVYDGTSLAEDWAYHAAPGFIPSVEAVPGTNVGAFLRVDYSSQTSTFYVITPAAGFALYTGEGGVVGLRTSFQRPENAEFVTVFADMMPVGDLTIDSGAPFHGRPAAGTQTQTLWRYTMEFPRDIHGEIYTTNPISVFYAPYLRTTNEVGGETDVRYLVAHSGLSTNNVGQLFHEAPEGRDYAFQINPPFAAELQDPGFEAPAANTFAGSPWSAFNDIGRDTWAARTGEWGGYFPSWDPGNGIFFQDVAVTGTTCTFSLWVKRMLGASVNAMEMKIEWFNSAAHLMHSEVRATVAPADERWHRLRLTSTLPAGEPLFARVVFFADFNDGGLPFHEAVLFDDAEFYSGGFTSVQPFLNGDFERGINGFTDSFWDPVLSDWVGRDTWAARNGSWGGDFQGFQTGQPQYEGTLSQGLNLPTGTYVFSAWLLAEDSILLTNAELRIEWLKDDFSPAQESTVQPLALPLDNNWYYYAVTGTCLDAELYEVRPVILAQWDENLGGGNKAIKIDDAAFGPAGEVDSDLDGLPDAWEWLHFGSLDADPFDNDDGDDALNWEEYVADTHPTNEASYFPNVITNLGGFAVLTLVAGPPTTNSRVYDVWWSSNLVSGAWTPMNFNRPGEADGSAVFMAVTNDAGDLRYYTTGVKLP